MRAEFLFGFACAIALAYQTAFAAPVYSDTADIGILSAATHPPAAQGEPADTSRAPNMAATKDPLLPEVMSPGERIMWGEKGLMRRIGAFPLTEESREKEMGLRRTMLTIHEIGGFATLAAMLTTVVYGQLTLNGNLSLGETHQAWATATIISYFTTASLSLLSPPPMVRRKEWNTVSIHKGLAIVHFTGMILTPLLADGIAREERGSSSPAKINRDKAHIHQVSGYITTATFAAAMMVITF